MNIINPAFAGITHDYSLTINSRNQWSAIENSPRSQLLTFSSKRKNNVGLGFSLKSNKAFIESKTLSYIDFSYRLQLSPNSDMYLGLKGGGVFLNTNLNALTSNLSSNIDPALKNYSEFKPNLGIGVLVQLNKTWISLSIPRILEDKNDEIFNNNIDNGNFFLGGGLNIILRDNITFKPGLLTRFVKNSKTIADITSTINIYDKFEFGINYRTNNNISGLFYLNLKNFNLGYAYETSISSNNKSLSLNTHEIILSFKISKGLETPEEEEE